VIDYSKIAPSYDQADFRTVKREDPLLHQLLKVRTPLYALDLGCGTANYIIANCSFDDDVYLFGIDSSIDMLRAAKRKRPQGLFLNGDACEGFPFREKSFDYITCRFTFHHFERKDKVLDEIKRCLKKKGIFSLLDVEPYSKKNWWVYKLFPEVIPEDKKRFWPPTLMVCELESRGFRVVSRIRRGIEVMGKRELLERLSVRDTSQLHMVSDLVYYSRLAEVEAWPNDKSLKGDFAYLHISTQID